MTVAPAKIERVTADDAEILDFNTLRNALGLQHSLASPLVDALRARTRAPQVRCVVTALPAVTPRDAQCEVVFVFDLPGLDLRSASFHAGSLLLGEFEADVRAGAESHQSQQSGAEIRHRQAIVNRGDKNNPEDNRPRKNLEPVETVTA